LRKGVSFSKSTQRPFTLPSRKNRFPIAPRIPAAPPNEKDVRSYVGCQALQTYPHQGSHQQVPSAGPLGMFESA
jgi:hypothetical protein